MFISGTRYNFKEENNMTEKMICTSECEDCSYGAVDDSNKAKVMVHCSQKDKTFFFGQMIQCDDKEKKNSEN